MLCAVGKQGIIMIVEQLIPTSGEPASVTTQTDGDRMPGAARCPAQVETRLPVLEARVGEACQKRWRTAAAAPCPALL